MDKIATDIDQSKKLHEIGIDSSTADMHYSSWTILAGGEFILSPNYYGQTIEEMQEEYGNQIIPAWSLSALFNILPKGVSFLKNSYDKTYAIINTDFENEDVKIEWYDDPIDAAFEMVVWLKENKYI